MTSTTSSQPVPAPLRPPGTPRPSPRGPAPRPTGWLLAGIGAGLAGSVGLVASSLAGAVYEPDNAGDVAAIVAATAQDVPQILVFHVATMVTALLLLVFAAGLRRMLQERTSEGSLLPDVAASGLLLVSVAGLLGTGLTTEFVFAVGEPGLVVPETVAFFGHWTGTIPWLWGGAGVSALALGLAALRHGAAPRWLGWLSLVLGGVTTLVAVSPLQYLTAMVAPLWLLAVSVALLVTERRGSAR